MPCGRGQGHRRLRKYFHSTAGSTFSLHRQPTACAPCAAQFGVTDPGNKSGTATNGAIGNAAPATGGQGTIATPATDKNGQVKGPRAACDIQCASHSTLFFYRASLQFLIACVIALELSFPPCAPAVEHLGTGASRSQTRCPATLN
jgi:hypothetical protein